jgi:hypothetical protein
MEPCIVFRHAPDRKRCQTPFFRCLTPFLALAAAVAGAQAPPPSAFPGEPPPSPPADILVFRAETVDSATGTALQLRWEAINAYAVEIEPDIGAVATYGTRYVAPESTTRYTLNVTGDGGIVSETITVEPVPGAERFIRSGAESAELARLRDGTLDLSGLYIGGREISLQAPAQLTPAAEAAEATALPESDLGQGTLCLPPGVPNATLMPFPLQIVHREDVLVILYEAYHLFRIIPIGVEHSDYLDPSWMGYSVAHWDGDTLVVDVRGFNDQTRIAGHRHSTEMTVTERYTRIDRETIRYEAVVEDPGVFAEPVRYAGKLSLRPDWEIGEYVCTENNKDYDALFDAD